MAHKKGVGSSKNGRESESKRLGVKLFGGQLVAVLAGSLKEMEVRFFPTREVRSVSSIIICNCLAAFPQGPMNALPSLESGITKAVCALVVVYPAIIINPMITEDIRLFRSRKERALGR